MFVNIFVNRLKCTVRDRSLVFWTLIFPLILGTFFNLAFSKLSSAETFEPVDIAVINNTQYQKDEYFRNFIEQHSKADPNDKNTVKLFNSKLTTEEDAKKLLDNDDIVGYITYGDPIKFTVKNSGFEQTIVKSILDDYNQTSSSVGNIAAKNPAARSNAIKDSQIRSEFTKAVQLGTKSKPDEAVSYFYALIAMACMYGSFFGLKEITDTQANLSKRAARLNVAPVHKLKLLTAGLSASFVVMVAETMLLIAYLVFALKVDFGNQIGYIILTCAVGSAAGLAFGTLVSAIVKKSEGIKVAILIAVSMTASFLAGLMFGNMKYIIQKNVPILSYINPSALITDSLYALYYYDTHTRFFINIGLLGGITLIFCAATYLIIRRRKYDYI